MTGLCSIACLAVLQVVLSGGCCRIPLLRQQMQEYFSAAEFVSGVADDEIIAVGCAVEVIVLAIFSPF